jgi:hypothetical protein
MRICTTVALSLALVATGACKKKKDGDNKPTTDTGSDECE